MRAFCSIKSKAPMQAQGGNFKLQSGQENGFQSGSGSSHNNKVRKPLHYYRKYFNIQSASVLNSNCVAQTTREIKTLELKMYFKCWHKELEHKNRNEASWSWYQLEHWYKYQVLELSQKSHPDQKGQKQQLPQNQRTTLLETLSPRSFRKSSSYCALKYIKLERMYKREFFPVDKGSLCCCRWKEKREVVQITLQFCLYWIEISPILKFCQQQ